MILGLISTIFSTLGIYGYFSGNFTLLYIGMTIVILEHIIGLISKEEKGLTTIWIALLFAFGMICAGINWLQAIAVCLCFENTISFFLGILLIIFLGK